MLGGDDERIEENGQDSTKAGSGQIDEMVATNMKGEEIVKEDLATVEENLKRYVDTRIADVEKKQEILQSSMGEMGKKLDHLHQVNKGMDEKLAAILKMMQSQATNGGSSQSTECITVRDRQCHQGATDESSHATWLPNCVRDLVPFSLCWNGLQPTLEESHGDHTKGRRSEPNKSIAVTTAITTAAVFHQNYNNPSHHGQNAASSTTTTSMHCQPRTQPPSDHQSFMAHPLPRGSYGQSSVASAQSIPANIPPAVLELARGFHLLFNAASGNSQIRLTLEHYYGNTINCAEALVHNNGQQVASRSQSLVDPRHPCFLDENSNHLEQLPPQILSRRASCEDVLVPDLKYPNCDVEEDDLDWLSDTLVNCASYFSRKDTFLRKVVGDNIRNVVEDTHSERLRKADAETKIFTCLKEGWLSQTNSRTNGTLVDLLKQFDPFLAKDYVSYIDKKLEEGGE